MEVMKGENMETLHSRVQHEARKDSELSEALEAAERKYKIGLVRRFVPVHLRALFDELVEQHA